jgi:hypothetical protein
LFNMERVPQRSDLERMSQKQNFSLSMLTGGESLPSKDPAHRRGSDHFLPKDSKEKNPYHTLLVGQTLPDFSTLARKGARIAQLRQGPCKIFWGRAVAPELWRLAQHFDR